MKKKAKNPFVVTLKTCGDCAYLGFVTGDTGRAWCCDYTFKTRKLKPKGETCAQCSVKVIREREMDDGE